MRNDGVFPVGRDGQIIQHPAAIGQLQFFDYTALIGGDDADDCGDKVSVRASDVQMVGDQQVLAVRSDSCGDWLAFHRDLAHFLSLGQVENTH